jgi:hypothetical protein
MSHYEHGPTMKAREASDNRRIVAECAVSMQFGKIGAEQADEVECIRPLRVAGKLCALPRADMGEEFTAQFRNLLADFGELRRRGAVPRKALQIVYFPFELFEFPAALTLFHQRFLAHHFDSADAGHFLQPAYQAFVDANSLVG